MNTLSRLAVLAAASAHLANAGDITVKWGTALTTGEEILIASRDGSVLFSSCGNRLTVGDVDMVMDSNSEGLGSLSVGGKQYDLGDGNICGALWGQRFAEVSCQIPWQAEFASSSFAAINGTADCFAAEDGLDLLPHVATDTATEEVDETPSVDETPNVARVFPRQNGCPKLMSRKRADNPKPTKWHSHKQLTPNVNCGNGGTCSTSYGKSYTVTNGATFSLTGYGKADWINAGYSVSWSTSKSFTISCNGSANQRVCVKNWRRFQGYDVTSTNNICGQKYYKTYNVRSPMSADKHQEFYCARGTDHCRSDGYQNWESFGSGTFPN